MFTTEGFLSFFDELRYAYYRQRSLLKRSGRRMGKTRVALFLGSALLLWGCGEEASNENGEQEEAEE